MLRHEGKMTMTLTLKHALVAIILALSFAYPVSAGPFEDAVAAYGRGDYETALKLMQPLANQGDARARFNVGTMHLGGKGVPQDSAEAGKWFLAAAQQGYAPAQFNLGVFYAKGLGVPQDYVLAYMWLSLSAAQGDQNGVKARDEFARLMTPTQIAEGEKLAREWKPTAQPPR
jgi:TPR repeat protein